MKKVRRRTARASGPPSAHAVFLSRIQRLESENLELRGEISRLERKNAALEEITVNDPLTGLLNRRGEAERILTSLNAFMRTGESTAVSVLYLDLDRFKQYNDRFGHAAGDVLLVALARLMRLSFRRATDLLCRRGGDEFCIYLFRAGIKTATRHAENFIRLLEEDEALRKTGVTVSIGIACRKIVLDSEKRPSFDLIVKTLQLEADSAMYEAKSQRGKHSVHIHNRAEDDHTVTDVATQEKNRAR